MTPEEKSISNKFILSCPNCEFSRMISADVIPSKGARAICPKCKTRITIPAPKPQIDDDDSLSLRFEEKTIKPRSDEKVVTLNLSPTAIPVTFGLITINILAYLLIAYINNSWMKIDIENILSAGGNSYSFTIDWQWWRLLTSMFIHGGLINLVVNLSALYFFGLWMEQNYSSKVFLGTFLTIGITGAIIYLLLSPESIGFSSSTAIMGVIGMNIVYMITQRDQLNRTSIITLASASALYVIYVLWSKFGSVGINYATDIVGLLIGIALTFSLGVPRKLPLDTKDLPLKRLAIAAAVALFCACMFLGLTPLLSKNYDAHVKMLRILKELNANELVLAQQAQSLNADGRRATPDKVKEVIQLYRAAYELYTDRLNALQPSSPVLKNRQEIILSYIFQKNQGFKLMRQGLDLDNMDIINRGTYRLGEANKLVPAMKRTVYWYQ